MPAVKDVAGKLLYVALPLQVKHVWVIRGIDNAV